MDIITGDTLIAQSGMMGLIQITHSHHQNAYTTIHLYLFANSINLVNIYLYCGITGPKSDQMDSPIKLANDNCFLAATLFVLFQAEKSSK